MDGGRREWVKIGLAVAGSVAVLVFIILFLLAQAWGTIGSESTANEDDEVATQIEDGGETETHRDAGEESVSSDVADDDATGNTVTGTSLIGRHTEDGDLKKITLDELLPNTTEKQPEIAVSFWKPGQRDLSGMINLQSVVDGWVRDYRGSFSSAAVEIYDVDYGTVVASYNANASMYPRSLYKLFYTYDAYTRINAGKDDPNAIYWGSYSLSQCLDLMIRVSHNPCAEQMLGETAREQGVGQLVSQLGLTNTQPDGLKTSAHDVSLLLQQYYKHPDWPAGAWTSFRDAALNQTWTYRKGFPNGFSEAAVYNKTGYGTGDVYNDAALVEFAGGTRRYVMAVMTAWPSSHTILTELGSRIEYAILYGI